MKQSASTNLKIATSHEDTEKMSGLDGKPYGGKDYAAYVAALGRLLSQHKDDSPLECEELRATLKKRGHVPITQDNVAREAGLTRKALVPGGRFEKLGAQIKEMRPSHGVNLSTTGQLTQLKSELAEARQTIVVLRSKLADAIVKVDQAEHALAQERNLVERLRKQAGTRRN